MSSSNKSSLELIDSICSGLEELQRSTEENLRLLGEAMSEPKAKSHNSFLIEFTSAKPPFQLKGDGIYLGKRKIINKVIPVK